MNPVVFHIAGGDAFFTGVGCIAAAVGLGFHRKPWVRQAATLLCVLGMMAVAVSATPLPYWYYGVAGVVTIAWIVAVRPVKPSEKQRRILSVAMTIVWLFGLALEILWHLTPTLTTDRDEPLIIYGDSLSAGLGEGEAETWPAILRREHGSDIRDHSRVGATVASVLKKVHAEPPPEGIVILEIGGNDLLGNTAAADFERDLDRLLALLSRRHSRIVMFELPLLPFYNAFGLAQRRLARRYGVSLIPKRVLLSIVAGNDATLDSIHLTQAGHRQFAAMMRRVLGRE